MTLYWPDASTVLWTAVIFVPPAAVGLGFAARTPTTGPVPRTAWAGRVSAALFVIGLLAVGTYWIFADYYFGDPDKWGSELIPAGLALWLWTAAALGLRRPSAAAIFLLLTQVLLPFALLAIGPHFLSDPLHGDDDFQVFGSSLVVPFVYGLAAVPALFRYALLGRPPVALSEGQPHTPTAPSG